MIKTESLEFAYNSLNQFKFPDLAYTTLDPLLVVGPSGCGKTTFLHLLGGLLKPSKGSVFIAKTEINQLSNTALDRFRGKNIGIIFQRPHLIKSINVLENLKLSSFFADKKNDNSVAFELLEKLGLADKAKEKPHKLSQGEQQRLTIARAVIKKPLLLLADEPTASLDDANCEKVVCLLQEQAQAIDAQLIIVTHDQRLKSIFPQQLAL